MRYDITSLVITKKYGMALSALSGFGILQDGIVPKIVLTAFAGNSIVQVLKGEGGAHLLWLALIVVAWIAIGWFARNWLKSREDAISGPMKDD